MPNPPAIPQDTTTELNTGTGGSKMDESSVVQVTTGLTVHRTRVVPGGDDGSIQSFIGDGAVTAAAVRDRRVVQLLEFIRLETRRQTTLLRYLVAEGTGKTLSDEDLDGLGE